MRMWTALLLTAALMGSLAGCGGEAEQAPETPEIQENREETPGVYHWGELTAAVPEDCLDLVTIEQQDGRDGELLTIWETESLLQAQADGEENPKEVWGWICTLMVCDRMGYEQSLVGMYPGLEYLATDGEFWYALSVPTDMRCYRSAGGYTEESMESWTRAMELVPVLAEDFVARNELTPWTWEEIYGEGTYAFAGEHLTYVWQPKGGGAYQLTLSQPVRQGEDGIWCVEQVESLTDGMRCYYFPDVGTDALTYYQGVQKAHDDGNRSDHATPEQAVVTFLRNNPFMPESDIADGTLTRR